MYSFVNAPVEVSFVPNTRTGARVSQFSSWYPTNDLHFKPEITAPGGFMLSTVPTTDGGYSVQSGTSMATPYAAGIIALFLSARGSAENTTSEEVRNMLLSTAIAMPYVYNGKEKDYIAPTSQQGLGLVDAKAFLEAKTVLDTTTISLNDTENFISTVNFTITNRDTKPVTYTLSHVSVFVKRALVLYQFYLGWGCYLRNTVKFFRWLVCIERFIRTHRTICHS